MQPPAPQIPPVITINADTARYYQEICDRYSTESDAKAIEAETQLAWGDACDWAIIGFTVQDWLSFKAMLIDYRLVIQQLLADRRFYEDQLTSRHDAMATPQTPPGKQ